MNNIIYVSSTSECKEVQKQSNISVICTHFKTSKISDLSCMGAMKAEYFPVFTCEKKVLYVNIAEKCDALEARKKGEFIMEEVEKYANDAVMSISIEREEHKCISDEIFSALVDGIHLGQYSFTDYKSKKREEKREEKSKANKIIYIIEEKASCIKILQKEKEAWTAGVRFTKDMINTPPSIAIPSYIEEKTRELFAGIKNVKITSVREQELKELGAGGILSVGQASRDESRFLVVEYRNAEDKNISPIGLVGKGVTYDTGGLSLKPSNAMTGMKKDMGGAATVLGGLYACARCELKENIVAVVPLAENLISEKAYKPDDIVTMMNGKTVEITNTDAEGRLLLGDALVYAEKTFSPRLLIDMATLTGACAYAIGEDISAVFSNDEKLYAELEISAKNTDEPIWRLPLYAPYEKLIESRIADIVNAATGFKAGTIQAALFLKQFVNAKTPWSHFDIAYSSFDAKTNFATGQNVRLIYDFVKNGKK